MKKEGGITLISLIIYIMVMTLVIAAVSNISASFYSNLNDFDNESESAVAYSKFNMIFLNDIKKEDTKVLDCNDDYIILSSNGQKIQYSVQNKTLYRNKVKVCDNIKNVSITSDYYNTIEVSLTIGEYKKITSYTIEKI